MIRDRLAAALGYVPRTDLERLADDRDAAVALVDGLTVERDAARKAAVQGAK